MKAITVLFLTFITVASAAPSANAGSASTPLSARQTCTYDILCNETDEGEDPDPDTARCCALVGGTGDAFLCNDLALAAAENFARCCGRSGGYTFFADPNCPPISV
ncbi:hypothetical protein B0T21DRAFT_413824 [Apiosordaria backusii]|uniref:Uncharacterized protein n=1 Tax=Apiosordaria backusii TaxID=314023 RepID=A0AA40B2N8_9PEZI|nr:hypothetical protein B0T21DRAFT_413824 [Apiosordaria backusii]